MRAKLLSAAILLALSYPAMGTAQNQSQQQQTQASGQPIQQIRQKIQQAEQALQQRDEQGAQQVLDQASQSADEAMQQIQGEQRQMLSQVQQGIRQAQQALQQRDQQGAAQALAQARQLSEQPMTAQQTAEGGAPGSANGGTAVVPADGSKTTTAAQQELLDRAEQEQATAGTELQRPFDTEEIIGQTALTPEGEDLGEIGDLVMSAEGDIEAAIIDVGGFLGIGERQVAVDWSKVQMSTANDQIVVDMTREELEAAPEYDAQQLDGVVQ